MWLLRRVWWQLIGRRRWRPRRTYTMGGSWGDSVEWVRAPNRIVGWKDELPRVGDCLYVPMKSGKTARYRFTKVDPQRDPPDMFFADIEPVDYQAG